MPPDDDTPRRTTGEFEERVTDDELLDAVREHDPAATSEVAETVGLTRQGADHRLRRLADAGRIRKKKIGASLVWSPARETTAGPSPSPTADGAQEPRDRDDEPPADTGPDVEAVVDELDIQGQGPPLRGRRAALVAILEHLREHGDASAGELKELADEHPHGFDGGVGSFWANTWRRDALPQLRERGIVESGGSAGTYYWAGEGNA